MGGLNPDQFREGLSGELVFLLGLFWDRAFFRGRGFCYVSGKWIPMNATIHVCSLCGCQVGRALGMAESFGPLRLHTYPTTAACFAVTGPQTYQTDNDRRPNRWLAGPTQMMSLKGVG